MGKIYFLPTNESHYLGFEIIANEINKKMLFEAQPEILILNKKYRSRELYHSKKEFIREITSNNDNEVLSELKNLFNKSKRGVLLVGNDSAKFTKRVIRLAKKNNLIVILLQDGWLASENINKPIKSNYNQFTYYLKWFLSADFNPFKNFFGAHIGQNSDYYFVYSEIAKQEFIKAGLPEDRIRITGSPRHSRLKKLVKKEAFKGEKIFAFLSSPPRNEYDREQIIFSFNLIKILLDKLYKDNYIMLVKYHPSEKSDYLNLDNDPRVKIFTSDISSLLGLSIEFAFTFNSTVNLELVVAKVPFTQLVPKSRSISNSGYFEDLPIINLIHEFDLKSKIELQKKKNLSNKGQKYILDANENIDSTDLIIKELKRIMDESL